MDEQNGVPEVTRPTGASPAGKGIMRAKDLPNGQINAREMEVLINRYHKRMKVADAVIEAGYECSSREAASSKGSAILKRHKNANGELLRALSQYGIDATLLASKINDGLNAEAAVKVRDSEGNERIEKVDDHRVRHLFVETTLDITGARAPKVTQVETMTFEQRLLRLTHGDKKDEGEES